MRSQSKATVPVARRSVAVFGFSLTLALGLVATSTELSAAKRVVTRKILKPCEKGLSLSVEVNAAEGIESKGTGLKIFFDSKTKKGRAYRTSREDLPIEFSEAQCKQWQEKYFSLLDRMLFENKRPERGSLHCNNTAALEFKVGTERTKAHLCLGDAKADGLTDAFRKFYDGSENLIPR